MEGLSHKPNSMHGKSNIVKSLCIIRILMNLFTILSKLYYKIMNFFKIRFGITLNLIIAIFAMYWTVFLVNNPCEAIIEIKAIVQITRMYTESRNCQTISTGKTKS